MFCEGARRFSGWVYRGKSVKAGVGETVWKGILSYLHGTMRSIVVVSLVAILISCSSRDNHPAVSEEPIHNWDSAFGFGNQLVPAHVPGSLTVVPVRDIPASRRIERYLSSIADEHSVVVQIVNDTDERVEKDRYYIEHGDTTKNIPSDTVILANMCWIVQNSPDSLRYVFIRNINDPADTVIVDTTVYYPDTVLSRIEQWGKLDSSDLLHRRPYIRTILEQDGDKRIVIERLLTRRTGFMLTTLSYWSKSMHFRLALDGGFSYSDCATGIPPGDFPESVLAIDVIGLLCKAKELQALEDIFVFRL